MESGAGRAKSEIASGRSNFGEWPTRAVVGGERRRIPFPALHKTVVSDKLRVESKRYGFRIE